MPYLSKAVYCDMIPSSYTNHGKNKNMNEISIQERYSLAGYALPRFVIDGKHLYDYITDWLSDRPGLLNSISPVDDLEIAWTDEYDFEGDARFMRFILQQDRAITPILSCPDDFDFSCIVIVADVIKLKNTVLWRRIGKVDHSEEVFEEEKRSGILYTAAYTAEDWKQFGNNIAKESVDSQAWCEWISENWCEELFRRRVNYTFPYYQDETHIEWFAECNFEFDRAEYEAVVEKCYSYDL